METNEEKAREIAIEIEKNSSFLSGFSKKEIVIEELKNVAIEMANYKDRQFENKIRQLLNTSFYINPYNENIVCSDCFEFDGSFIDFVESFIKKLNEIDV